LVTILLAVGDPLDDVQREAEKGLEFARKAKFSFVVDIITGQLKLIQTLRGLTPSFCSFNDEGFDEVGFEQYLEADPQLIFAARWYWIRKLQARFYAGDYASALAAGMKAEVLLGGLPGLFESTELLYYAGLARAAHFDAASLDERVQHLVALRAYHKQLDSWAENCPENYGNRASLIGAEIARIEGRDPAAPTLCLMGHTDVVPANPTLPRRLGVDKGVFVVPEAFDAPLPDDLLERFER